MAEIFEMLSEPESLLKPTVKTGYATLALQQQGIDPDTFSQVFTQVTLEKGELVQDTDHYATLWNMFFVNRQWYYHNNNGLKLAKLFPAFAVVEFLQSPFGTQQCTYTDEQQKKLTTLNHLFKTCYLVLPFKHVRSDASMFSRRLNINFIGAKFNGFMTERRGYRMVNHTIKVHAVCAYGYFRQTPDILGSSNMGQGIRLHDITADAATITRCLGTAQREKELTKNSTKVLEVFQACEQALLGEQMAAA